MKKIPSPCTKVCTMDPSSGLCLGCGRSIQEIGMWSSYSDEQRNSILQELPKRMDEIMGL